MTGRPLVVGLTGGIASGKSSAASMFAGLGVPVLDLDRIGREVTGFGSEGLAALAEAFGKRILHADGTLDRQKLADLCFGSDVKTEQLNAIVHPLIWQYAFRWIAAQKGPYVLIEASVLIESGAIEQVDRVVVLLADMALRRQRARQRNVAEQRFADITARQCTDEERRAAADFVIENNGSLEELQQKVESLHWQLADIAAVDSFGEVG